MSGLIADAPAITPMRVAWQAELGDYVVAMVVSGDRVFFGTGDGQVHAVDVRTGQHCWRQHAHDNGLLSLALSPDGARIATGGAGADIKVWDRSGAALACITLPTRNWLEHLQWSPTGGVFASAAGREVRLHTPEGGVTTTWSLATTVSALAFRSDGAAVAAASYGGVSLWSLRPEKHGQLRTLPWKGSLVSLRFSHDGKIIAGGTQDGAVHFWRLASGDDSEMSGYRVKPRAIAFSDDSRWLATAGGEMLTLWSFRGRGPEGSEPLELFGHRSVCTQLAFRPGSDALVSGDIDGVVLRWPALPATRPQAVGLLRAEVTALTTAGPLLLGADATGRVVAWHA
jgi:WD40 repeat protein